VIDRVVVINDLAKPQGGASLLALQSARAFAERGLPVTLLTGDRGPASPEAGIECVSLGQDRLLSSNPAQALAFGLYNPAARRMIADWIARNDTPRTVYHLHGWSQILSPSLFDALDRVGGRLLMTAHDFFLTCPNGASFDYRMAEPCQRRPMSMACLTARCDRRNYGHKLWRSARQFVQRQTLDFADLPPQLLIHRGMRPYFERAGVSGEDMVVLPNPVTPYSNERIAAERNHTALFVGRMEKTKGIDLALAACRLAGVKLAAVGDGATLDELREEYPEMDFIGRLPSDRIGPVARQARFLLMPSRHMEPFGLTAVEAMWSGLPVLCSDKALIAGDIERSGAGVALDPNDIAAFAKLLGQLAADNATVRRMSAAAYENTRDLALAPDRWIDALLDAYSALLDGGKAELRRRAASWTSGGIAAQSVQSQSVEGEPCA
jgi:glycosyltransferase involved in cell wall biosynthesis